MKREGSCTSGTGALPPDAVTTWHLKSAIPDRSQEPTNSEVQIQPGKCYLPRAAPDPVCTTRSRGVRGGKIFNPLSCAIESFIKAQDSLTNPGSSWEVLWSPEPLLSFWPWEGWFWHQKDQRRLVPGDTEMGQKCWGIAIHPQAGESWQSSGWAFAWGYHSKWINRYIRFSDVCQTLETITPIMSALERLAKGIVQS